MNEAAKILFDRDNPRNWQIDYPHENGNYCQPCSECGRQFVGHKRRYICKECYYAPDEQELLADCFNPDETDEEYFLRRKKSLGLEAYYKPLEE